MRRLCAAPIFRAWGGWRPSVRSSDRSHWHGAAAQRRHQRVPDARAGAVFTALLAWALYREVMDRRVWTAMLLLIAGGMLLVLALALRRPLAKAWDLPLVVVIAFYAVAKLFELGDHAIFAWTGGWVSGHSLKHAAAALAALPVLFVMHNGARIRPPRGHRVRAQFKIINRNYL